jgi:hypothetical protein
LTETRLLQDVARSALSQAIVDDDFRDTLGSSARVQARWPVRIRRWLRAGTI